MTQSKRAVFALVSSLMEYPGSEYFRTLPELLEEFAEILSDPYNSETAKVVNDFVRTLREDGEQLSQEKYVAVFDHHPDASLYLAWRRYGSDRSQGKAMGALNALYRTAGLEPVQGTLPDYLPRVLAFFSLAEEWAIEACIDGFGPEMLDLDLRLKEIGCPQSPLLSLALTPLREKWPDKFRPRTGQEPAARMMAQPEKEYAPLIGPYFSGSHEDTYIPE